MYSHHCTPYDNALKFILGSWNSKVEHYRVRYTPDSKLTVDDECFFENLTKLVEVGNMINKQWYRISSQFLNSINSVFFSRN